MDDARGSPELLVGRLLERRQPGRPLARLPAVGSRISIIGTVNEYGGQPFSLKMVRAELAHMFGFAHSKVEVIVPYVGGAYGSKSYFKLEPLAVAMPRAA